MEVLPEVGSGVAAAPLREVPEIHEEVEKRLREYAEEGPCSLPTASLHLSFSFFAKEEDDGRACGYC